MSVLIDKREGTQFSLNPYFEAGEASPFIFSHRNEGKKVSASGLVDNYSESITAPGNIQTGSGASGIQGFTKFQANVETLHIEV